MSKTWKLLVLVLINILFRFSVIIESNAKQVHLCACGESLVRVKLYHVSILLNHYSLVFILLFMPQVAIVSYIGCLESARRAAKVARQTCRGGGGGGR